MTEVVDSGDFCPDAWRLISSSSVGSNFHETLALAVRGMGVILQTRVTNTGGLGGMCAIPAPVIVPDTVVCEFTRRVDDDTTHVMYREVMTVAAFTRTFEKEVVAGSVVSFAEKPAEPAEG